MMTNGYYDYTYPVPAGKHANLTNRSEFKRVRRSIEKMFSMEDAMRLTDADIVYYHAKDDIEGRWLEFEPIIIDKDYAKTAYMYAKDVVGGRWPEGESVIKTKPWSAYYYARDVIGGRWPEAESVIKNDPYWAKLYAKLIE